MHKWISGNTYQRWKQVNISWGYHLIGEYKEWKDLNTKHISIVRTFLPEQTIRSTKRGINSLVYLLWFDISFKKPIDSKSGRLNLRTSFCATNIFKRQGVVKESMNKRWIQFCLWTTSQVLDYAFIWLLSQCGFSKYPEPLSWAKL